VAGALIAAEFSIVSLTRARRLVALMGLEGEGEGNYERERERDPIAPVINKAGAPSSISPRLRNPRARCVSTGTTCLTYHPRYSLSLSRIWKKFLPTIRTRRIYAARSLLITAKSNKKGRTADIRFGEGEGVRRR